MELGSMKFDYGTVNYGPNERVNLEEYDKMKQGQRIFMVKTPKFIKKLLNKGGK